MKKYIVGWCPLCAQGWLKIVKDKRTQELYVCCEECETQWGTPKDFSDNNCLPFDYYGKYEVPSKSEVISLKWGEYIIREE